MRGETRHARSWGPCSSQAGLGHFQGWTGDNGLEVINRFESPNPQSITLSVEGDDRGYNITVPTADHTVQVTIMTGEN